MRSMQTTPCPRASRLVIYRFFVLDERDLKVGGPITLGWVGHPVVDAKAQYRFESPRTVVKREQ